MKSSLSLIVTFVITLISAVFIFGAKDLPLRASLYPLVVGITTLIMCLLLIVTEIKRAIVGHGMQMETVADLGKPASTVSQRFVQTLVWILALYAGTWLLGFNIAAVIFLVSYITFRARCRWFITLGLTALVVILLVYFDMFLHAFLPEGILKQWLPWLP